MVTGGQAPGAAAEKRLQELGVQLPPAPTPFGAYVEATDAGNFLFLSGMLPVVNRHPQYVGRVGGELTTEDGYRAARVAALSALAAAREHLGSLDRIDKVMKLGVYIATECDDREHPRVADGASELLLQIFGADKVPPRVVLGVASIPLGMPVELELIFRII